MRRFDEYTSQFLQILNKLVREYSYWEHQMRAEKQSEEQVSPLLLSQMGFDLLGSRDFLVTLVMVIKHIGLFLTCCWVLIIGICGLLLFMAFSPTPTEPKPFVCGNAAYFNDSIAVDGKAVFQNNCASCHHPMKDAIGPALAGISSFRSKEWVCKFLTQPKFIPGDKRTVSLRKQYGLSCMKFPQLSCEEVNAALRFFD